MRAFFSVVLFFFVLQVSAQSLGRRLEILQQLPQFICDSTGLSQLPRVNPGCHDSLQNRYHVTDLNSDGLKDIIYSGLCQPYMQTVIFLNNGESMHVVYDSPGELLSVEFIKGVAYLQIIQHACCCIHNTNYTELRFNKRSKIAQNMITYHGYTNVHIAGKPEKARLSGMLRTSPEIDDFAWVDTECSGTTFKGNQVFEIPKPKEVSILHREGNWVLVYYREKKGRGWIGWMYFPLPASKKK